MCACPARTRKLQRLLFPPHPHLLCYAMLCYAVQSQVTSLGLVHPRSGVVRTLEQQAALDLFDCRLVAARLRGFVFFGSANSIGIKLHEVGSKRVGD